MNLPATLATLETLIASRDLSHNQKEALRTIIALVRPFAVPRPTDALEGWLDAWWEANGCDTPAGMFDISKLARDLAAERNAQ